MKKGFVLNESCFPDLSWDMDETSFKMVYELKAVLETNYDIVIDAHNVEYLRGLLLGLMKPVYLHNYITQMEQESDTNIYGFLIFRVVFSTLFFYACFSI